MTCHFILHLPLRDFPLHFTATQRFPLQLDLLPERAPSGTAELLLRVQTQEGLQTGRQERTLWLLQRGGGLSLLQVGVSLSKAHGGTGRTH